MCDINSNFKVEKELKIKTVTDMRDLKDLYKLYKIKRTVIESELVNDTKIGYNTLHILCLNNQVDLLMVSGKMFKKFHGNIDSEYDPKYIIYTTGGKYEFKEFIASEVDYDNLIEISNIEKPLNSISYYKLPDLRCICEKIGISVEPTDKKQILYNKIQNYVIKLF